MYCFTVSAGGDAYNDGGETLEDADDRGEGVEDARVEESVGHTYINHKSLVHVVTEDDIANGRFLFKSNVKQTFYHTELHTHCFPNSFPISDVVLPLVGTFIMYPRNIIAQRLVLQTCLTSVLFICCSILS
jgi:hypothetical protein